MDQFRSESLLALMADVLKFTPILAVPFMFLAVFLDASILVEFLPVTSFVLILSTVTASRQPALLSCISAGFRHGT